MSNRYEKLALEDQLGMGSKQGISNDNVRDPACVICIDARKTWCGKVK